MPPLEPLARFLDETLDIDNVPDYPDALNGIQLANIGDIERIACAVDVSTSVIDGALAAGAKLLIVHHGMFWGGAAPITGARHRRLWSLITHDVAVYAAHLPLDVHPVFGNNVLLARRLGLQPSGGFVRYQTIDVGLSGESNLSTAALAAAMSALAIEQGGQLVATPFDAGRVTRRWGICTGAGASSSTLKEAEERGLDTLIVGEGPHHTAVEARELGLVVLYGGHYATETLGVRAIADALAAKFQLTSTFVAAPTGL
jgi:dinuclear metal center YbgI/SA1388 family protein